jgi:hypothetical protein
MTYGNGPHDDSQQLRDIQDLIAKLEDVNRKLALPTRVIAPPAEAQPYGARPAEAPTA